VKKRISLCCCYISAKLKIVQYNSQTDNCTFVLCAAGNWQFKKKKRHIWQFKKKKGKFSAIFWHSNDNFPEGQIGSILEIFYHENISNITYLCVWTDFHSQKIIHHSFHYYIVPFIRFLCACPRALLFYFEVHSLCISSSLVTSVFH